MTARRPTSLLDASLTIEMEREDRLGGVAGPQDLGRGVDAEALDSEIHARRTLTDDAAVGQRANALRCPGKPPAREMGRDLLSVQRQNGQLWRRAPNEAVEE